MDIELINSLGNLGAVAWLGVLSFMVIKQRRNGNGSKELRELKGYVMRLIEDVAKIKGHLNIN